MKKTSFAIAILVLTFCYSCGDKGISKETESTDDSQTPAVVSEDTLSEYTAGKFGYVISNIPIPFETLDKLYHSGVKFHDTYLNSPDNANKYLQANTKALNLGIYGGDLTYVISFEQFSLISNYLKTCKRLADDLGIPLAFNNETLTRFQTYKNNKDTLQNMLYTSYDNVDKTLKSNSRISLAALVVTGGFIEGFYIALKNLEDSEDDKKEELKTIVWQQNYYLNTIIDLLKEFNGAKYFDDLISRLQEIKRIYDFADKKNITQTELKALSERVTSLRNDVTTSASGF
jgi:hypothetical protein